jgi:hypothetical protein
VRERELTLEIVVEQDDIDRGVPGDAECCAVARAIRRLRPGADVCGGPDQIFVDGLWGDVPYDVASWMIPFDGGRPYLGVEVAPFGFRLTLEAP